jgi:esterase/lipase superfamily enzyme
MGNRALLDALERIYLRSGIEPGYSGKTKLIDTLILAAPDVDASLFRSRHLGAIHSIAERTTLYFTDADRALWLSQRLHASPRLGLGQLPSAFSMEAVDTGAHGLFSLRHSYYGSDPVVIDDMRRVLNLEQPAEQRPYLRESETADGVTFWRIDRSLHARLSGTKKW